MRFPSMRLAVCLVVVFGVSATLQAQAPGPVQGRRWGPEQVVGLPDTARADDLPTAWATLRPNMGMQWLRVGFPAAVDIAEVRIRETFNPGAVFQVTAFTGDGNEEILWNGADATANAPADFVVQVQEGVTSNDIKIYLDTSRRDGWNEIDAVELVGRDGTRQWAARATASSTYADRPVPVRRAPARPRFVGDPFVELQGAQVTVHVEGGKTRSGVLARNSKHYLVLTTEGGGTFIINKQKIIFLETTLQPAA